MGKNIGIFGENEAVSFLKQKGLILLDRNYHSKYGEIDIIAKDDKYIIFCEVKTRKDGVFSKPAEAVNLEKQKKILKTALDYLQIVDKELKFQPRFDVMEIIYEDFNCKEKVKSINHIENAFGMEEDFEDF